MTTISDDVVHTQEAGAFSRHKREYSDMCPICGPKVAERTEKSRRVLAIHKALVQFGYTSLTVQAVEASYDRAMSGHLMETEIIDKLVASQLDEAGLLPAGTHRI